MSWQLQKAKQHLSELVDRAVEEGPQIVTRHGKEVAVVLGYEDYQRLLARRPDFKKFLQAAPDLGELELKRSSEPPRETEL